MGSVKKLTISKLLYDTSSQQLFVYKKPTSLRDILHRFLTITVIMKIALILNAPMEELLIFMDSFFPSEQISITSSLEVVAVSILTSLKSQYVIYIYRIK